MQGGDNYEEASRIGKTANRDAAKMASIVARKAAFVGPGALARRLRVCGFTREQGWRRWWSEYQKGLLCEGVTAGGKRPAEGGMGASVLWPPKGEGRSSDKIKIGALQFGLGTAWGSQEIAFLNVYAWDQSRGHYMVGETCKPAVFPMFGRTTTRSILMKVTIEGTQEEIRQVERALQAANLHVETRSTYTSSRGRTAVLEARPLNATERHQREQEEVVRVMEGRYSNGPTQRVAPPTKVKLFGAEISDPAFRLWKHLNEGVGDAEGLPAERTDERLAADMHLSAEKVASLLAELTENGLVEVGEREGKRHVNTTTARTCGLW